MLGRARELLLHVVAPAERHRHELTDDRRLDAEAIQPGLVRRHEVVLWAPMEARGQRGPRDRVHLGPLVALASRSTAPRFSPGDQNDAFSSVVVDFLE